MTEFTRLSESVARTDYSNGDSVYVNFGESAAEAEGVSVPAKSFVLKSR